MILLPIGEKVGLTDYPTATVNTRGTIIGYALMFYRTSSPATVYLVDLEAGFYGPNRLTYVSTLVVHPDNCRSIETENEVAQ